MDGGVGFDDSGGKGAVAVVIAPGRNRIVVFQGYRFLAWTKAAIGVRYDVLVHAVQVHPQGQMAGGAGC